MEGGYDRVFTYVYAKSNAIIFKCPCQTGMGVGLVRYLKTEVPMERDENERRTRNMFIHRGLVHSSSVGSQREAWVLGGGDGAFARLARGGGVFFVLRAGMRGTLESLLGSIFVQAVGGGAVLVRSVLVDTFCKDGLVSFLRSGRAGGQRKGGIHRGEAGRKEARTREFLL